MGLQEPRRHGSAGRVAQSAMMEGPTYILPQPPPKRTISLQIVTLLRTPPGFSLFLLEGLVSRAELRAPFASGKDRLASQGVRLGTPRPAREARTPPLHMPRPPRQPRPTPPPCPPH